MKTRISVLLAAVIVLAAAVAAHAMFFWANTADGVKLDTLYTVVQGGSRHLALCGRIGLSYDIQESPTAPFITILSTTTLTIGQTLTVKAKKIDCAGVTQYGY